MIVDEIREARAVSVSEFLGFTRSGTHSSNVYETIVPIPLLLRVREGKKGEVEHRITDRQGP
jgi:hypothetical protein